MMNRRQFVGLMGGVVLASRTRWAAAQMEGMGDLLNAFAQGRYLPLYNFLLGRVASGSQAIEELRTQVAAMVGNEEIAIASVGSSDPSVPDLEHAIATEAVAVIAKAAKFRQVVMINEAHVASQTREFNARVVVALKKLGFQVLAAETFSASGAHEPDIADWRAGLGIPPDMGFYTKDPIFAEAVRNALALDYKLANYEARQGQQQTTLSQDEGKSVGEREEAQASNLIEEIFTKQPSARVVVWCGHDHLRKLPTTNGRELFAMRFKRKTGIDPLTIDQATSWPCFDPSADSPRVKAVLERFRPDKAIVVRQADGSVVWSTSRDTADLTVFHPRLPHVQGRPGWLVKTPDRRLVQYRITRATSKTEVLLQAIHADEQQLSVPADQCLVPPGVEKVALVLRPGSYRVRLETPDGFVPLGDLEVPRVKLNR